MSQQFSEDFGRAVATEREKARVVLQKKASGIYELFKPTKKQMGNSTHDVFLGKVEYATQSTTEVFPDTPTIQHPSLSTRANKAAQANIHVGVPRKVAQVRGMTPSQLAQAYTFPIMAAKYRRLESQVTALLSETYRLNPIMDDLNEQEGSPTMAAFPLAQNVVGLTARTAPSAGATPVIDGRLSYIDFMETRLRIADNQGSSLTMNETTGSTPRGRTLDDFNAIVFCDNLTWFAFINQNRNTFFNRDFSKHYTATFDSDVYKFKRLHDMAVITTSVPIVSVDPFANRSTFRFGDDGVAVESGGTLFTNAAGTVDMRPIYIMPRGAFTMRKPVADDYDLSLKTIQNKSYNQAYYGECNVYGKRIYDELVFRLWVNVANRTAIA